MKVDYIPDKQTESALLGMPDKVSYAIARITMDMTVPKVPMSRGKNTSGQLRRSTVAYGVRGSNGKYSIGSSTSYATYVYNMDDSKTNWTTPGTHSKWFHRTFEKDHTTIIKTAIDNTWKGKM